MTKSNIVCSLRKTSPGNCGDMKMDLGLDHCLEDDESMFANNLVKKNTDVVLQIGGRHLNMFNRFMKQHQDILERLGCHSQDQWHHRNRHRRHGHYALREVDFAG
jgi:hypothetical protein